MRERSHALELRPVWVVWVQTAPIADVQTRGAIVRSRVCRQSKHLNSFEATDPTGAKHTLDVWVQMCESTDLSGAPRVTQGIPVIRTHDGSVVAPLGDGKYEVIDSGLTLHSDHPNAP